MRRATVPCDLWRVSGLPEKDKDRLNPHALEKLLSQKLKNNEQVEVVISVGAHLSRISSCSPFLNNLDPRQPPTLEILSFSNIALIDQRRDLGSYYGVS